MYPKIDILQEDINLFRTNGYKILTMDFRDVTNLDVFYAEATLKLEFPYDAHNLSAFEDSPAELDLNESNGLVVFRGYDLFIKQFPDFAYEILDILATISRLYLVDGVKLIFLVQMDDTNVPLPKIGGYYPFSNDREVFEVHPLRS